MLQLLFGVIAIYKTFYAIIKASRFIDGIICSIAILSLSLSLSLLLNAFHVITRLYKR